MTPRLLSSVILLSACGPKPPPPSFADSAAFHAMSGRVHGMLERDVDGDGVPDVVLAERQGDGYAVAVLRHEGDPAHGEWQRWCTAAPLAGDDLDALRFVTFADRRAAVFALVLTENPEEVEQRLAVIDLHARCAVLFEDEVALGRPDPERLVAPTGVRGGAVLDADGGGLVEHDEPGYLHLLGAAGEVLVLTSLHERAVRWADGAVTEAERQLALTRAQPATVSLEGAAPRAAPELADGDDRTRVDAPAGAEQRLTVRAERPFALLELHEGCDDPGAAPLTLSTVGGVAVTLGAAPPADAWVRATGRSQGSGVRRDLVALREPVTTLTVDVGPRERPRCLRDVKVYGFVPSP